jgi:hypothetical protein
MWWQTIALFGAYAFVIYGMTMVFVSTRVEWTYRFPSITPERTTKYMKCMFLNQTIYNRGRKSKIIRVPNRKGRWEEGKFKPLIFLWSRQSTILQSLRPTATLRAYIHLKTGRKIAVEGWHIVLRDITYHMCDYQDQVRNFSIFLRVCKQF